jgi:uncharacterized protein YcbK (DUF882 family)
LTRREVLQKLLLGAAATPLAGVWARPAAASRIPASGSLALHNLHTGESVAVRYRSGDGVWLPDGLQRLDHLFRCHYNGEEHPIDPRLYQLLDVVRRRLGAADRPFQLISGYRSAAYNDVLRRRSPNVAKHSYHLRGMAADVRLDGVAVADLRRVARESSRGGVGSYPEFVHLDVGPERSW